MRIVVTGAAGFIGSHLSEQLLTAGHNVVGLDGFIDTYQRHHKQCNLARVAEHPAFTLGRVDLRTDRLDEWLEGAEVVVNQAAMPGLPHGPSDFPTYASCNVVAVSRLLDACRRAGVRKLVHISTSSVYGAHAVGDEKQPTRPVSPYGVTKLAAEHLVLSYFHNFGFPATILRYFSVYGPRQRPDMAFRMFIDAVLQGRPIAVFGDGEQSRSNTYIDDCVRGTTQAIDGAEPGEIYNIGGGEAITLNKVVSCIGEQLRVTPEVRYQPARAGDQRHTFADTSKARGAFGFEPLVVPAEGLRRQIAWQAAQRTESLVNAPMDLMER